ncbi:MAG: hypothetical protein ABR998_07580 [Gemmatimonadales bacterium]
MVHRRGHAARPALPALRAPGLGERPLRAGRYAVPAHQPRQGGTARVGLGLWHSTAGTIVVEGLLFVAGVWLYARTTRARDGIGRWAFWSLVGLLALFYVANLFSTPPANPGAFAWFGLLFGWLLVAWAWWIDRHRQVRGEKIS